MTVKCSGAVLISGGSVDRRNRAVDASGSRAHRGLAVAGQSFSSDHAPNAMGYRIWTAAHLSTAAAGESRSVAHGPSDADPTRGADRSTAVEAAPDSEAAGSGDIAGVEGMDCAGRTGMRDFRRDNCRHQVDRPTRRPETQHMLGRRNRAPAAKPLFATSSSTSMDRPAWELRPQLIRPQQMLGWHPNGRLMHFHMCHRTEGRVEPDHVAALYGCRRFPIIAAF